MDPQAAPAPTLAPRLRKYANGTTHDPRPFWKFDGSSSKTYYTKGDEQSENRAKKRCIERHTRPKLSL